MKIYSLLLKSLNNDVNTKPLFFRNIQQIEVYLAVKNIGNVCLSHPLKKDIIPHFGAVCLENDDVLVKVYEV